MNSLNRAEIIGNLTRDPELKTTQSGKPVTTVGVATNRTWKDATGERHEEAEFHNVVCWGRLAEIVRDYLKKGAKVFFAGRLQTRNWEDEAGIKHFRTEIVADDMIILSPKNSGESFSDKQNNKTEAPAPAPKPKKDDEEISASDLPF